MRWIKKEFRGEHDFDFKLKHAQKFLQEGAKVKAFVFFRGRTIIFKEQGEILLLKLAQALEEIGVVEVMPKLEGKKMTMVIAPIKKKWDYAKNENKIWSKEEV